MIRVTTRQYSGGVNDTTVHDIDAVRMGLEGETEGDSVLALYDANDDVVAMFSHWYMAQKMEELVIKNLTGETVIKQFLKAQEEAA
jgi:hypothetical protein